MSTLPSAAKSRPSLPELIRWGASRLYLAAMDEVSPGAAAQPADPVVAAIDIGGTKMAAAVVAAEGVIVSEATCPTEGAGPDELFEHLCRLVASVIDGSRLSPEVVGVGCGGPMQAGGQTVTPLNIPQWQEFPLRSRLADEFGLPVFVDNDAKALALGERWLGAAKSVDNFIALVVSTGIGGGIVLDGRLLDGHGGNAGHLGHVIVDPLGRPCLCGARGCLEAQASGTAILAATGVEPKFAAPAVRHRCGVLVGRALATTAALLDLRLAVVAGSVALGFGDDFFSAAQGEADRCARLAFSRGLKVVPAGNGAKGPLLGAAAIARAAVESASPSETR